MIKASLLTSYLITMPKDIIFFVSNYLQWFLVSKYRNNTVRTRLVQLNRNCNYIVLISLVFDVFVQWLTRSLCQRQCLL